MLAVDLLACARGGYKYVPKELWALEDQGKHTTLSFVIAIIEMRADWPAWNEVAGVRSWAHGRFPCPKCDLPLCKMITCGYVNRVTLHNGPWNEYRHEQYLADVKRSTVAT
jgi:hypothetical protein